MSELDFGGGSDIPPSETAIYRNSSRRAEAPQALDACELSRKERRVTFHDFASPDDIISITIHFNDSSPRPIHFDAKPKKQTSETPKQKAR